MNLIYGIKNRATRLLRPPHRILLFGIFLLALGVRGYILERFQFQVGKPQSCMRIVDTARHVMRGEGFNSNNRLVDSFSSDYLPAHHNEWLDIDRFEAILGPDSSPEAQRTTPFFGRPLCILILAAIFKVTGSVHVIWPRIIQEILNACVCFILFDIGRRLWSIKVGLIAAVLFSIWMPQAYSATMLGQDSLTSFFYSLCLYSYFRSFDQSHWKWPIICGLLTGLSINLRETALIFLPIFSIGWILQRPGKRAFVQAFILIVLSELSMIPWSLRNQAVTGNYHFLFAHKGIALLDGIVDADPENRWGYGVGSFDADAFVAKKLGKDKAVRNTPEFDNVILSEALRVIKADPIWWARSVFRRFIQYTLIPFTPWQFLAMEPQWVTFKSEGGTLAEYIRQYPWTFFWRLSGKFLDGAMFVLAIAGFFLYRSQWRSTLVLLLIPVIGISSFVTMKALPSYIIPLQVPYFLLSSAIFYRL